MQIHVVVGVRTMHQATVVPHNQVTHAPLVCIYMLGLCCDFRQVLQERNAVVLLQTYHVRDVCANVQQLSARLGMCTHQRMDNWRAVPFLFLRSGAVTRIDAASLPAVLQLQPRKLFLPLAWQCFECHVQVRELCIPTARWDLNRVQQRRERRFGG